MKMYVGAKELRLVGKAWEIRHTLRKLSRGAGRPDDKSLEKFLARRS
ncbi:MULTISPECIES: Z-ring formation inhibitor MciZ [Paenibacillus]|nr:MULTISPECIES: Z-ring formation inhibitor MciZ [Paenibacillus]CDN43444.1 hypothetical protein BN871_CZ_00150 [Paenibacillus sp. P22]